MICCFGRKAGTVIYNELKNGMLMSKDLKQETLLESQAELEQENEETEEGCLYSAAVAILQEKTFETLDNEGLDEALSVLDKFYTQYEVVKGFQYNSLKASLILKGLNAMNSIGRRDAARRHGKFRAGRGVGADEPEPYFFLVVHLVIHSRCKIAKNFV